MDGQETTMLIDLGPQVSSISTKFCEDLMLQIQPLGQVLELEWTGGAAIPYLRLVEVDLQILGIRNYNENVLLLVTSTMTYSEKVLVVVGSKIIDKALSLMTMGELVKLTMTWWQAHFGAVMSGLLQLSCASSDKNRVEEEAKCSSQEGDPVKGWRFCLDDVRGLVHTTQKVTICHLAQLVCMQTLVSRHTVCGFMCSQSKHQIPSCQQQWYPHRPIENCI